MPPGELPKDVQQLLRNRIRSIEQLEIVLLLREHAERHWTAAETYQEIRSSERSVQEALKILSQKGLLKSHAPTAPTFSYSPESPELGATLDRLAHLYAERRVRIVEAIYSEPVSAVDEFAKAFRIRKDHDA